MKLKTPKSRECYSQLAV